MRHGTSCCRWIGYRSDLSFGSIDPIYRTSPYRLCAPTTTTLPDPAPHTVESHYPSCMAFQPSALPEIAEGPGEIDYRLARQRVLAEYRAGRLDRTDVCDAHPELRRAGAQVGTLTDDSCPVCDDSPLAHVTYVFGPRLPTHGRCISAPGELARLSQRRGEFSAYVVEVCPACAWNHLVRAFLLAC